MDFFPPIRGDHDFDILLGAILCIVGTALVILVLVSCVVLARLYFGDQYDMVAHDPALARPLHMVEGESSV